MLRGHPSSRKPRATLVSAAWQRQLRNPGVTDIKTIENRGHSLTIDNGWRELAEYSLDFAHRPAM